MSRLALDAVVELVVEAVELAEDEEEEGLVLDSSSSTELHARMRDATLVVIGMASSPRTSRRTYAGLLRWRAGGAAAGFLGLDISTSSQITSSLMVGRTTEAAVVADTVVVVIVTVVADVEVAVAVEVEVEAAVVFVVDEAA